MHVAVSRRARDLETRREYISDVHGVDTEYIANKEFSKKQSRLLEARVFYAASRVQGVARGFLARVVFRQMLLEKRAAIRVQRTIRGWLGRLRWKHEYWRSVSVVKSRRALAEMLRRSRVVREERKGTSSGRAGYHWKELFDPLTAAFWYYNAKTAESTWRCPLVMQHRLVCAWEGYAEYGGLPSRGPCRCVFSSLQAYQNHLIEDHRWYCVACEHLNTGASFPVCALCGNSHGDGEGAGVFSAMQAMRANATQLRRTLGAFLKRDDAASKDFIRGYSLRDRLVEIAEHTRAAELTKLGETDAGAGQRDWEGLLEIHYDEKLPSKSSSNNSGEDNEQDHTVQAPPPSAAVTVASVAHAMMLKQSQGSTRWSSVRLASSKALASLAPLETLATLPLRDIQSGVLPAPAFHAIVKGDTTVVAPTQVTEEFNEKEYAQVILPDGGLFLCSAFTLGLCTRTTCPLAHPGLRDNAKLHYYAPVKPGLRKRPYVVVCQEAVLRVCDCEAMTCPKYHPYLRPDTAEIIRRIYPIQSGGKLKSRTLPSGVVDYRGQVSETGFTGYGVMVWKESASYMGEWRHNQRHGFGIYRTVEGFEYIGGWDCGVRSGLGYFQHPEGRESYLGEFTAGRMEGAGRWEAKDGAYYEGMFKNDKFEGLGVSVKRSGDRYLGQWLGGVLQGFGCYQLRSGETYKGDFFCGKRHGRGVCTFSTGAKYFGQWYCDLPSGHGVYQAPTSPRLRFRDTCVPEGVGGRYVGELESGFLHGKGSYFFPNGDVYDGEWRRNRAHGVGTYYHSTGCIYKGEWRDNQRCGKGQYIYSNASSYTGYFENNDLNGKGFIAFANGASYRGMFVNSHKHGKGIFTWSNGNVYKGNFVHNEMNGYGELTYRSGCAYKGQWLGNKKHGKGEFTYMSGDVYVGDFNEDRRHGRGRMTYAPGTPIEESYEGDWVLDEMHGQGVYRYRASDSVVYEGAFKQGKREGKGRLTFKDGGSYEGDFFNEQMDGIGVYVGPDGVQYEGEWSQNLRHGVGVQVYPDKTIYSGQFYMNRRQGFGTTHYKDGRSSHYGEWAEDLMLGSARGVQTMECGSGPRGGPKTIKLKVFGF